MQLWAKISKCVSVLLVLWPIEVNYLVFSPGNKYKKIVFVALQKLKMCLKFMIEISLDDIGSDHEVIMKT